MVPLFHRPPAEGTGSIAGLTSSRRPPFGGTESPHQEWPTPTTGCSCPREEITERFSSALKKPQAHRIMNLMSPRPPTEEEILASGAQLDPFDGLFSVGPWVEALKDHFRFITFSFVSEDLSRVGWRHFVIGLLLSLGIVTAPAAYSPGPFPYHVFLQLLATKLAYGVLAWMAAWATVSKPRPIGFWFCLSALSSGVSIVWLIPLPLIYPSFTDRLQAANWFLWAELLWIAALLLRSLLLLGPGSWLLKAAVTAGTLAAGKLGQIAWELAVWPAPGMSWWAGIAQILKPLLFGPTSFPSVALGFQLSFFIGLPALAVALLWRGICGRPLGGSRRGG